LPYLAVIIGFLWLHNAWITVALYYLGMIIIPIVSGYKPDIKSVFRGKRLYISLATAVMGALGGVLLYFLWPYLSIRPDIGVYLQSIGLNEANWPYFIAFFILINPYLEEAYWRGYLGSNSKKPFWNDVFFAGYHIVLLVGLIGVIWLPVVFLVLFLGAWIWRQADRLNQGLLPSIVSHFTADTSIILVIYYIAVFGN
jgi:membrane protease YdiL (CAAX protease family)